MFESLLSIFDEIYDGEVFMCLFERVWLAIGWTLFILFAAVKAESVAAGKDVRLVGFEVEVFEADVAYNLVSLHWIVY